MFQEEGTVHAKYLEVGLFIKWMRSVRCALGLYNVEGEHGECREVGRPVRKDGVRKPGWEHWDPTRCF